MKRDWAKALIAVDVQTDFLPGGALGVPQGHLVIRPLLDLAREADYVIVTRDWHPQDHCSFAEDPAYCDMSWPSHCVQETAGADIDHELTAIANAFITKGDNRDSEQYSGFQGHDLPSGLTLMEVLNGKEVQEVTIGGLALDYCVKATALDAVKNGLNTTVALAATRPVAYLTGASAIAEMAARGVSFDCREL